MKITNRKIFILSLLFMIFFVYFEADADISQKAKKNEQIQRTYMNNFDLQFNTVSNFAFPVTNYGILFLDVANNRGGGYWPRGSLNQYFFGGGIWFAAQKWVLADSLSEDGTDTITYRKLRKLVEVTYNPNSGTSWMVPGRIEDGDLINNEDITKYRTYFSTDFKASDGEAYNEEEGQNWPIWDASTDEKDLLKFDRYFGYYISDPDERTTTNHSRGPAFISGEDIFATFKDTDLNYYEGGAQYRRQLGYPMRLQFEQYIYSWGFGRYKDFIFLRYDIINMSQDTLVDCWLAPVMDVDIAQALNSAAGAANDKARFYDEDPSLNLCAQWTLGTRGEAGRGFGYLGFDFLESPATYECDRTIDTVIDGTTYAWCIKCLEEDIVAVDNWETSDPNDTKDSIICIRDMRFPSELNGYMRKDSKWYPNEEQLGLKTFRRWPIAEDLQEDDARYSYMESGIIEAGEGEAGDYRFMMATGPINVLPGDTVRTVVGIILANAIEQDATGQEEDMVKLVEKDKFAQEVYDNNFRAPEPPYRPVIYTWQPLNHAISLSWDSTAEISADAYERGLDFMGYRLYRARRIDLDTFDVNQVGPSSEYTSGKGPLGWKQLAQWELPTPFMKSYNRAGTNPEDMEMPLIDSLQIIGPHYERNEAGEIVLDTFAIKVMRMAKGLMPFGPPSFVKKNMSYLTQQVFTNREWTHDETLNAFIFDIDTARIAQPWGPFLKQFTSPDDFPLWYDPYNIDDPKNKHFLLDSVLVGTIKLNRAILDYNPLYWKKVTTAVNVADTSSFPDTVDVVTRIKYLKNTYRTIQVDGAEQLIMDQLHPVNVMAAMQDTAHVKNALDSIYNYIQTIKATVQFPDFEGREDVRDEVIIPYMNLITRGNTFVDIGDDNRSGEITYHEDITKTEKIVNNVPYYYKLLAYDEGDFAQPTPRKLNAASEGNLNFQKVYARASAPGLAPKFEVTYVDSARIGGLYNFKFFAYDNDRVRQLFDGHELELTFEPNWSLSSYEKVKTKDQTQVRKIINYSLYNSIMKINDITDENRLLYQQNTYLEQRSGYVYTMGGFTENAQSWVNDFEAIEDEVKNIMINTAVPGFDTTITRSSTISTGDFKQRGYRYTYGFLPPAYGTIGFSFDYTAQQKGGVYRPDSSSLYPPVDGRPSPIIDNSFAVPINFLSDITGDLSSTYDSSIVYRTQSVGLDVTGNYVTTSDTLGQLRWGIQPQYGFTEYGSYNNGPADYLLEFKPGGQETLRLHTKKFPEGTDFVCNYLTIEVKNAISYKRPNLAGGDSIEITYPLPIEHMPIDTGNGYQYQHLLNLGSDYNSFIGKYNLSSYGFFDVDDIPNKIQRGNYYAFPADMSVDVFEGGKRRASIGQQGRFYLNATSTDGSHKIHFVNAFLASGVTFVFDMVRLGQLVQTGSQWGVSDEAEEMEMRMPKAGDKVMLRTNGGALGFPLPGAKVKVRIEAPDLEAADITDDVLDQVLVVPNPYYITHQGQASPYDAKIYFTKLPKRATISIYTATGDLIRTLEHDEYTSPEKDKLNVEIWDLLSKNRQRVQSQTLVAVITTPDGASTVKQFSVVVGGFRLVPED